MVAKANKKLFYYVYKVSNVENVHVSQKLLSNVNNDLWILS